MIELPGHISFSQVKQYESCPRSWYLGYVRRGEEKQTWFLPIGSAVHQMVEDHLSLRPLGASPENRKAEDYFYPLVRKQMLIEPDTTKWLAGGPKSDPIVEDKALQAVRDCFERALEFLEDIDVWEVEYDASGSLPGLSVPIKAYIDIVGEYKGKRKKYHGPMIVDWKTGSKKPGDFQLQTYGALIKEGRWSDVKWASGSKFSGMYAMLAPKASEARPIDLSEIDPAEVGNRYELARRGMEAMMIEARENRSKFTCGFCFQAPNCMEWSGVNNRTLYYDRSRFDQPPY